MSKPKRKTFPVITLRHVDVCFPCQAGTYLWDGAEFVQQKKNPDEAERWNARNLVHLAGQTTMVGDSLHRFYDRNCYHLAEQLLADGTLESLDPANTREVAQMVGRWYGSMDGEDE